MAIKTFTHLLPQRYTDEAFRLEFKEMVTREVGRLDSIVAHIEGFAHPTVGVIDNANLSVLLQEAADAARTATEALDAQIKINADEGLPPLRGDAKALSQVFQHLFVNSIESASSRKHRALIKVRVIPRKVGSEVVGFRLAISDNGAGVSREDLERAFSPFFSTKAQGLGLGLPIAQRVVLDHGGRISLDSGSTGLCVNIDLPLEPPAAEARPTLLGSPTSAGELPAPIAAGNGNGLKYEPRYRIGN